MKSEEKVFPHILVFFFKNILIWNMRKTLFRIFLLLGTHFCIFDLHFWFHNLFIIHYCSDMASISYPLAAIQAWAWYFARKWWSTFFSTIYVHCKSLQPECNWSAANSRNTCNFLSLQLLFAIFAYFWLQIKRASFKCKNYVYFLLHLKEALL